jgi:adenylate cyclase
MVVISCNTALAFKDNPVDAKRVGRGLGVRYTFEDSVRKLDWRIRINAQLIDAEKATHFWAERFDRDADDLSVLQDEIIGPVRSRSALHCSTPACAPGW